MMLKIIVLQRNYEARKYFQMFYVVDYRIIANVVCLYLSNSIYTQITYFVRDSDHSNVVLQEFMNMFLDIVSV